jgi:hypothetical protein
MAEAAEFNVHPIHPRLSELNLAAMFQQVPEWRPGPDEVRLPEDAAYLAQFLSERERASQNYLHLLDFVEQRALETNRLSAGIVFGWIILFVLLYFFLGLALESAWAADYLIRSGRGPLACVGCYVELYVPAALLIVATIVVGTSAAKELAGIGSGSPVWWHSWRLLWLACGAGVVVVEHVGVTRRWHPVRCLLAGSLCLAGLYLDWIFSTH